MAAAVGATTQEQVDMARRDGGSQLAMARALLPEVVGWLRAPEASALPARPAGFSSRQELVLRSLLNSQGVAPLVAAVDGCIVGTELSDWLCLQLEQNRARQAAFAGELGAILAAAAARGLRLMPLKGSVLSARYYREPGLRPMADIDLLVAPADEPALHEILVRLGYRLLDRNERRHRGYRLPGAKVASLDGTHPDNPRPVEVHTSLRRSVWLNHGGVDFAPLLWAAAEETLLHGQLALLPSAEALLVDVAAHATSHLMRGSGMLLHLVDLGLLAPLVRSVDDAHGQWTYPALALAARVVPQVATSASLDGQATRAGPVLARLAASLPLDDRAGLNLRGVNPNALGPLRRRWQRWKPNPWLVSMAHPSLPLALAYPAYLGGVAVRVAKRMARPSASG